jgi:histidinol-phosphate aminotransferase
VCRKITRGGGSASESGAFAPPLAIFRRVRRTASSLWDYQSSGDPLPVEGELSIILDGVGAPRALIETTRVGIVRFDEVGVEHAHAEGEGDRTLAYWRAVHERFWREHSANPRGYAPDMPVVCERFRLRYPPAVA